MRTLRTSDEDHLGAHLATLEALRDEIAVFAGEAAASAELAAATRDTYAARYYQTINGRIITRRTVDIFAFAGDVPVATASGSSTWDLGGDGSLQINVNDPVGEAELQIALTTDSGGNDALLIDAVALAARFRCNVSPDLMDLQVVMDLLDSNGVKIPQATFGLMRQFSTAGESEFWQVTERIAKGMTADFLRFLFLWQTDAAGASVDLQIIQQGLFNDHTARLNEDEVIRARLKYFEIEDSFTTVSGLAAASHTGALIVVSSSGGNVEVTLNDDAAYGDQIFFLYDIAGIDTLNFVPTGTDAITKDFALPLGISDRYRIVTATYWDDNGTDTWNLSISAGDT